MVHGQGSYPCYGSIKLRVMSDKRKLSDKEIEKLRKLKKKLIESNEVIKK